MRITTGKIIDIEDLTFYDTHQATRLPSPIVHSPNYNQIVPLKTWKIRDAYDFSNWKDGVIHYLGPDTQIEVTKNPKRTRWYDDEYVVTILSK